MGQDKTRDRSRACEALERSKSVLLIDWHEEVPRAFIDAGYEVFSYEGKYFRHEVVAAPPVTDERVVAPTKSHHRGYLIYLPLEAPPASVDLVCTYRPPDEQIEFVRRFVLPLGAKWFWVERGDESRVGSDPYAILEHASDEARAACEAAGVTVIEGLSAPVVLAQLRGDRSTPPR
jgi:hypothetical protein